MIINLSHNFKTNNNIGCPNKVPNMFQTFYTGYVVEKFKEMNEWKHKLAAIFYGPSWEPGKPRLGLDEDKIKVYTINLLVRFNVEKTVITI